MPNPKPQPATKPIIDSGWIATHRPLAESVSIRRVMNGYIVTAHGNDWHGEQSETVHATFEAALVRIQKDMAPAKLDKKHPAKPAA